MLDFQTWLERYGGAQKLAETLGVSAQIVNRWRRGESWPKIQTIIQLVKLSGGDLSITSVLLSTNTRFWSNKNRGLKYIK